MAQIIVTIVKAKDNKGRDVTECVPHNVCLSIGDEDQVVWGSLEGDFVVKNAPGTPRPLVGEPWQGKKGGFSIPALINPEARPGDFCNVIATLTLPSGEAYRRAVQL